MKYTATIRLPTVQYGFVEVVVEGTPEFIHETNTEFTEIFSAKNGEGLPKKEFDTLLDDYTWNDGGMTPDQLSQFSKEQDLIIQAIKRSKKREIYKAQRSQVEDLETIKNLQ